MGRTKRFTCRLDVGHIWQGGGDGARFLEEYAIHETIASRGK